MALLSLNFLQLMVFLSEFLVFPVFWNNGSLPFDVWDPEDFILKTSDLFLFGKPLWGESITYLNLKTFLWRIHVSLISELLSSLGCDSKKAPQFPNIWVSHSNFPYSLGTLLPNRKTSFVKEFSSAHFFQLVMLTVISINTNSHSEWGHRERNSRVWRNCKILVWDPLFHSKTLIGVCE